MDQRSFDILAKEIEQDVRDAIDEEDCKELIDRVLYAPVTSEQFYELVRCLVRGLD
jgi:hypothetical protein